ncbi:sterol desaturase family protein [Microbispora sp. CA-135349]|uniref:sterol desaturase family protein n=1 Tax=Microbispora sp. CA-135349 TaxID=3239953 RepID=UPI003D8E0FDB
MSVPVFTAFAVTARAAVRGAVRYGYVPLMLLGVNGAAVALASAGAAELWLFVLLPAAVGVSFCAERIVPYETGWNTSRGDAGRDVAHGLVNESLILVGVAVIPLLAAVVPAAGLWPGGWPFVVQVLLAVVVADAGITLFHYGSHKVGALWRFHAVHHSVTRFYGLNGLMKHPVHQTMEMAAGVVPLLLIGLPVRVASVLALAVAVQLLLQHSNADYRVGPLRYVLALNEGHRFHHLKWAGVGDVNFGLFTLVWDHLLGTYSYDPGRRFTSELLGMAAKPHYPSAYLAQLAEPFRASGACHAAPGQGGTGQAGTGQAGTGRRAPALH